MRTNFAKVESGACSGSLAGSTGLPRLSRSIRNSTTSGFSV
ncbi:Uncharacterised protein [Mycobacterium tuberculosis]|nr:Uncharacterised protein [Mycobacterium tuberculosis]